jgi:hypothetical protein
MKARILMHPAEQKRQARKRLIKAARKLEWALDQIIAALDEIDGDPDEEPSLGSVGAQLRFFDQAHWAQGANDDTELDDSDLEHGGDDEPSLGSGIVDNGSQVHWAQKIHSDYRETSDREDDDCAPAS